MKYLLIGFLIFASQNIKAQQLELSFNCSDVKIISEYAGDTINRCELGLNRQDYLSKLGKVYYQDERMANELRDLFHYGEDIFHYPHDQLIKTIGFDIFTDKFKILIDNQYLVRVGDNIDSCFKQYAPIPIREDRNDESAVIIYYKSKKKEENLIERSFLYIQFNKISRKVTHLGDVSKPGI